MGKVALITGGSSGIGAGIARVLAEKGFHCVLVSNQKGQLEEVKQEIVKAGGIASIYEADTTDKKQVQQMSAGVLSSCGVPDVLVNNAGMSVEGNIEAADYEAWDKMIDLNIRSHLYVLGEFVPGMKKRGTGHIVNMTSNSEKVAFAGYGVYCGTKHFWTGLSGALREELVGTEVKVTHVRPGNVDTHLTRSTVVSAMKKSGHEDLFERKKDKILSTQDVGQVVWEIVSRPSRCYQTEITMRDMFVFDPEIREWFSQNS